MARHVLFQGWAHTWWHTRTPEPTLSSSLLALAASHLWPYPALSLLFQREQVFKRRQWWLSPSHSLNHLLSKGHLRVAPVSGPGTPGRAKLGWGPRSGPTVACSLLLSTHDGLPQGLDLAGARPAGPIPACLLPAEAQVTPIDEGGPGLSSAGPGVWCWPAPRPLRHSL